MLEFYADYTGSYIKCKICCQQVKVDRSTNPDDIIYQTHAACRSPRAFFGVLGAGGPGSPGWTDAYGTQKPY